MNIFAHRGLLTKYPENSLPALMSAVQLNFAIETDLRLTKDNDFLLLHDDNFEKLAGIKTNSRDISLHEGTQYTYLNTEERVTSLRTFLDKLKKTNKKPLMALHIKEDSQNQTAYKKISDYFAKYDLYEHAFVFDFKIDEAKQLKTIDPYIKIALIISETKFGSTIHLWHDVKEEKCFDIVWAAEYKSFYTKELIQEMKQKKEKVYAMSPDVHTALEHPLAYTGYETTWQNLIDWEVDGICTDEPLKLQNIINA
ncbi:hypothetical protein BH09PAT2_BH09PAT2_02480 [soil metagenome]